MSELENIVVENTVAPAPVPAQATEQVLVFPADMLPPWTNPILRVKPDDDNDAVATLAHNILTSNKLEYMDRDKAENDPSFLQVIPYVLLKRGNMYFRYQRTNKSGESRLREKWSMGVGGHINPCDGSVDAPELTYLHGFYRELHEETGLLFKACVCFDSIAGLIYDKSNAVGQVHFGVVHIIPIPFSQNLILKDDAISNGEWRHVQDFKRSDEDFENWSRLVIDTCL